MNHNYGTCSVCHSAMIMKDDAEMPHLLHGPNCHYIGHEIYLDLYEDEDQDEADDKPDCICDGSTSFECHPECCPTCIDIGYNIYSKYNNEEEDSSY